MINTTSKAIKTIREATEDQLKGTMIGLMSRIIKETPVDEGRAKGNWQITIGSPAGGELDRKDKNGSAAINDGVATINRFQFGDSVYMSNNLPYIMRLEMGSSEQAPEGMVRRNIQVTIQELQKK